MLKFIVSWWNEYHKIFPWSQKQNCGYMLVWWNCLMVDSLWGKTHFRLLLQQNYSPSSSPTASGEASSVESVNSSFHFFLFFGGGSALAFGCLGLGLDRLCFVLDFTVEESDAAGAAALWADRAFWEPLYEYQKKKNNYNQMKWELLCEVHDIV